MEEMKIGFTELLVVFVVALLVIGPDKLPLYAKRLGEALQAFRKASDEVTRDLKASVIDPLEQAQQPLREALEPVNQLTSQVQDNVKDVERSFQNIGKAKPPEQPKAEPARTAPVETAPAVPAGADAPVPAETPEREIEATGGETV